VQLRDHPEPGPLLTYAICRVNCTLFSVRTWVNAQTQGNRNVRRYTSGVGSEFRPDPTPSSRSPQCSKHRCSSHRGVSLGIASRCGYLRARRSGASVVAGVHPSFRGEPTVNASSCPSWRPNQSGIPREHSRNSLERFVKMHPQHPKPCQRWVSTQASRRRRENAGPRKPILRALATLVPRQSGHRRTPRRPLADYPPASAVRSTTNRNLIHTYRYSSIAQTSPSEVHHVWIRVGTRAHPCHALACNNTRLGGDGVSRRNGASPLRSRTWAVPDQYGVATGSGPGLVPMLEVTGGWSQPPR